MLGRINLAVGTVRADCIEPLALARNHSIVEVLHLTQNELCQGRHNDQDGPAKLFIFGIFPWPIHTRTKYGAQSAAPGGFRVSAVCKGLRRRTRASSKINKQISNFPYTELIKNGIGSPTEPNGEKTSLFWSVHRDGHWFLFVTERPQAPCPIFTNAFVLFENIDLSR